MKGTDKRSDAVEENESTYDEVIHNNYGRISHFYKI